jgi:hypothetical protein
LDLDLLTAVAPGRVTLGVSRRTVGGGSGVKPPVCH